VGVSSGSSWAGSPATGCQRNGYATSDSDEESDAGDVGRRPYVERMLDVEARGPRKSVVKSKSKKPVGKPTREPQFRNWCFTWNNYPVGVQDILKDDFETKSKVTYYVYKPEVGAEGTRHIQGVVFFKCARSLGGVRRLAGGRAHWEPIRGTADQAIGYVEKEATADRGAGFGLVSFGTRPSGRGNGQGTRSDLGAVGDLIKGGFGARSVFTQYPSAFLRYSGGIEKACGMYSKPRREATEVHWYFGPTGCGKSHEAQEVGIAKRKVDAEGDDDVYWKDPTSKWWDGYHSQTTVIVDDYRCDFCTFAALLRLCDKYPLQLQVKGSTCHFTSSVIIITAPRSPEEMWGHRTVEDMQQLLRRIAVIKEFLPDRVIKVHKGPDME